MPDFGLFPLPFWVVLVALPAFLLKSWRQRDIALRLPMVMVFFTITVWYIVDVFYNDYAGYVVEIGAGSLQLAWWEVLLFIFSFGFLSPAIHRTFNRKYLRKPSVLLSLVKKGGIRSNQFQHQLDVMFPLLLVAWVFLMTVALFRTDFDFQGIFMPYLGRKAEPWSRGRVGVGFDAFLAAAAYMQLGLLATLGILFALTRRPLTAIAALLILFLTLPIVLFDRTRNSMLVVLLPGFLSFVFLRVRSGLFVKVVLLLIGFLALESWLKFVIENRGEQSIVGAFRMELSGKNEAKEGRHEGLNMFEELGFINALITDGSFRPSWGENYFSEVVNPIPRSLWKGKPYIGIDYAAARGQSLDDSNSGDAGVGATLSTGMIGQGVVNFGRILGPIAVALIMGFWVSILARQDLLGAETGRLFLYGIGLILTFNMGRDITFLVTYPFFFGYLLLFICQKFSANRVAEGQPV